MNRILVAEKETRVLTLRVPYVELVDLFSELILLDGLSARNRKRETPFEVLHLVHRVEEQTLGEERDEGRLKYNNKHTDNPTCIVWGHFNMQTRGMEPVAF